MSGRDDFSPSNNSGAKNLKERRPHPLIMFNLLKVCTKVFKNCIVELCTLMGKYVYDEKALKYVVFIIK